MSLKVNLFIPDTKEVFVGDGALTGGTPILSTQNLEDLGNVQALVHKTIKYLYTTDHNGPLQTIQL